MCLFVRQYETIYSGTVHIEKDMAGKFPDSYEQAKLRTEESFLKRAPDAISLAPAYWGNLDDQWTRMAPDQPRLRICDGAHQSYFLSRL